jgi:putative hydrolase of the HAD superfamily
MTRGLAWIFDLDDTLHRASGHIFPHLNRSMTEYIMRHLDLGEEEAGELRRRYWHTYGATLLGLIRHHDVDPHHFLWHTHQFPHLERMVTGEAGLRHCLRRLRGRKILFSNSPRHYARAVLDVLDVGGLFDAVYTIESARFQPKPMAGGFRVLLQREGLVPERSVLVEDSLPNLATARRLGMKTVWVSRDTRQPTWVDVKVSTVMAIPRAVHRLERAPREQALTP